METKSLYAEYTESMKISYGASGERFTGSNAPMRQVTKINIGISSFNVLWYMQFDYFVLLMIVSKVISYPLVHFRDEKR